MIVLGLTGSIAMGKTTITNIFRDMGIPVHDADEAVHRLMLPGGRAFGPVRDAFPGCVRKGRIDRRALGRVVFEAPERRRELEGIIHPLVKADRKEWVRARRIRKTPVAVLDTPLLFESGLERDCDFVLVASAPGWQQRKRVLGRPGMTGGKLRGILRAQTDDAIKRRRADFVIRTRDGVLARRRDVKRIVNTLTGRPSKVTRDG